VKIDPDSYEANLRHVEIANNLMNAKIGDPEKFRPVSEQYVTSSQVSFDKIKGVKGIAADHIAARRWSLKALQAYYLGDERTALELAQKALRLNPNDSLALQILNAIVD